MIKAIAKLIKVLNSESEPGQISLAVGFSMVAGFLPFFSPATIVIFLIVFLLRVNMTAFFLGTALFSGAAYLLDTLFHPVGLAILSIGALQEIWTSMYNMTIWRLQKFNNSIVMGGFAVSLLFFMPLVLLLNLAIRRYRDTILAWIRKTKLAQMVKASKIYGIYTTLSGGEV
ncbi:MAG: hypothetical protein A2X56_01205 [Nitrospirae bacterium GWC2_57_13]|nr:MAG: hypothetical protein A2X56_01205 [Nitrospirae bacterium GWC2_57_13]OGW45285.1 MAG: hypothetical protein A2X57_05315 [Nitrospirae bacterium GWD2_57_8]